MPARFLNRSNALLCLQGVELATNCNLRRGVGSSEVQWEIKAPTELLKRISPP